MKHFLRPAALFCTVLCCLALAGCSPSAPGAQPGSTAALATQHSSLTWLPAGIACAVSEAGYYDILISSNGTLRLLALYDFSAKQHSMLTYIKSSRHTDACCGA